MAIRTVDFLPEIFQTTPNKQFLNATLDQLVQEPEFKKIQGYIGRKIGPGVNPNDYYVLEPDATRANYQLEPGVVSLEPDSRKVKDAITYPGITDALAVQGGITDNSDRLYTSEYYTWDPFVDFDKFVNYSQYYWLPSGPDVVDVFSTAVPLTNDYTVTRINNNFYQFSGVSGTNPIITLVRGGNYTFDLNQTGNYFWIQSEPGVDGRLPYAPNISSRDVLGVVNNGEDLGTVTFNVPYKNAQQFYYDLTSIGTVDLLTDLKFNQINNVYLSEFLAQNPNGIDGITNLNNRTVVFDNAILDPDDGGWLITSQFDPLNQNPSNNGVAGSFDSLPFDYTVPITDLNTRYSVWLITYQYDNDGNAILKLTVQRPCPELSKFTVLFGAQWASTQWYRNVSGFFQEIPLLTAALDVLWYQDGTNPDIFGQIRLVDQAEGAVINVETDILGKKNYTSPNGVVFTNNLKIQLLAPVIPSSYQNQKYYVSGVGTAIQLLPVTNYVTPETYTQSASVPFDSTPYDVGNYDEFINAPLVPDYLTIGLDSPDLNAWTRSNRWFHIDVINASAEYNNTVPIIDNAFRARRPILEFRGGTRLFNMGTQGKQPVDIIDFNATDALSNINGTVGYGVDGYNFVNDTRVIFANDSDPAVRNKIYTVEFVTFSEDGSSFSDPVINLVPASDADVLVDQSVVCLSGNTLQGITFYYDGVQWVRAQEKTSVNQAPLFEVYDPNGYSLSNPVVYPSSTFAGSKLFSYAVGSGLDDTVLGFPLRYLTINNIGDIVFDNNLYTDTFIYVRDNVSYSENISIGFVRQYADRTLYQREIGWQTAAVKSKIYQQFSFVYAANTPLLLDVAALPVDTVPSVKVYVDSAFQDPGSYTYTTTENTTTITFPSTTVIVPGQVIEVLVLSDQVSAVAFYQVPINLENNPLNQDADNLTLGTIRTHYESIGQNLVGLTGKINGPNNSRDLGNIVPFGLNILQQSSPMTLAGYFLRSPDYNIFASLEFNSREYEKYKALLLNTAVSNDYGNMTVPEILTSVITDLVGGRTSSNPFYWSDMLPSSNVYTETTTVIGPISTTIFDTNQIYNYTSANYLGLLVYVNDRLLTRGVDYTVSTDAPILTITSPLVVGDVVSIQEYATTYGTFVPNTPTKMGLYPAYKPEIYVDTTYVNPRTVIRGHDGSITVAFDDFRDQLLLEFETRIYNNLKLDGNPVPLTATEVVPGQFRTTDYTLEEITQIEAQDFLTWVGWNKLDYKSQDYLPNNKFTWNYNTASNKLTGEPLAVGAWRGIYNYFYDTLTPNTTPWEMLGFTVEPTWWQSEYGPAPYTSGNLYLWDDLAAGLVRDPAGHYVLPQYVRPELTQVIPSGSEGALLSPMEVMVGNFNSNNFKKNWTVGDDGPVENAWRTSSAYPFAIMRLLALTRPAEFFSLFADRDVYKYDADLGEYLYNGRYRLDANGVEVYGNGVSKASYINWIVDYNRVSGINSTDALTADLKNLDVRLCYRMAAFTGKNLIEIYTEKSSPNSLNSSLLLPDESYNLLFYKNVPFDQLTYSSVIVQSTANGWAVYGYSTTQPYFDILTSIINGPVAPISAGGFNVTVPVTYSNKVVQVPYGYVFTNRTLVADFLLSYGALLEQQGIVFTQMENGYVLDWNQMVSEFLYWSGQGWAEGSIINLNPGASQLIVERPNAIVDSIALQTTENMVLNADRTPFDTRNLVVERMDNTFVLKSLNAETINYCHLKFTSYENMIVLDNESIFADLIYYPATGARQNRVRLLGSVTEQWNGQLNAPGFILNQDNIKEWQPMRKYARGEIVLYKNFYYSAVDIVQPKPKFDFNDWTRSDYTQIQQGLLPNLPNKSNQLANSYNVFQANLELNQDLFAYNLIGFKPREYMVALNLDSTSQVNLYRQFLGIKGTLQAAEIFTFADLGRGVAEYNIYENWGVQRGVYGANANKSFYELRLNEALLTSNPSLIQVVEPEQQSLAQQTVLVNDLWNQSYKITNPNILTTTTIPITDTALPSAGYVDIDEVDVTVFDINNTASLAANLDNVNVGSIVWVAKINNYDWGIFRTAQVPGKVTQVNSNLNGTAVVTFSEAHGLVADNVLLIKYFAPGIDGVYTVLNVPNIYQVTVSFSFIQQDQTVATGTGTPFTLQSQRVAQGSEIVSLPYANNLIPGDRAWIDKNGDGLWRVVEKQEVFNTKGQLLIERPAANSQIGTSIAQSRDNLFAFVGAPAYGDVQAGALYTFVRTPNSVYAENSIIECDNPGVYGLGSSVSIGNQTWGVTGAPTSIGSDSSANSGAAAVIYRAPNSASFLLSNLLSVPDVSYIDSGSEFGTSVAISADENWMYIGAPGINKVYAYGFVPVESQLVTYTTDGTTDTFDYSDDVIIDSGEYEQLFVVLNNQLLTYTTDYTVTSTSVVLNSVPVQDLTLRIGRRVEKEFTGNGVTVTFSLNEYLYSAKNIHSFKVEANKIIQRPDIDYTFNPTTRNITFVVAPVGTISVTVQSYYNYVAEITYAGLPADARFGQSVACSTDGSQILIGCPGDTYDSLSDAGSVYVYDRSVQKFIVTDDTQTVYQVDAVLVAPTMVNLNNQFLSNTVGNTTGDFTVTGLNEITLSNPASVGDILEVSVNTFSFLQVIGANQPFQSANYGQAVDLCRYNCSLYAGAPQDGTILPGAGIVERSVNQSRSYGTITSLYNPRLNPGDTIRINNMEVELSAPVTWNSILTYTTGTIVEYDQGLWIANQNVPANTVLSDTAYWTPSSWGAVLAQDINNSTVPNVFAYAGAVPGTETFGLLTISVKNAAAAATGNKLNVLPGLIGNIFSALGFDTYVYTQTIASPYPSAYAAFGSAVNIDSAATTLAVGAPRANLYRPTTFDNGTTYFDSKTTIFNGSLIQSGAIYTYDYFAAFEESVTNPGMFVFGSQVYDQTVSALDQFGTSVNYTNGILLAGSPGDDLDDSAIVPSNYGAVSIFVNTNLSPSWVTVHSQRPVVDISLINGVFTYDRITGAKTQFFDFFDPLQGKILGAARENIDYIGAIDPAAYNVGAKNNNGRVWTAPHLGQIWWDTNSVRFIDPNQDDIVYAARRWGQIFPGSSVDVYQWVSSSVPPANYTGPGIPKSIINYSVTNSLNEAGVFATTYYFWVKNITTINTAAGKTLSPTGVARYIADPRSSGISYVAFVSPSATAIYNALDQISAQDTILSIEFDRELTDDNIHVQYDLIPQNRADGFLPENLYRKLQDSLCGTDEQGGLVPDPTLSPAQRYGVQFRPRQSMFENRFLALQNYLEYVNAVLLQYPITEIRNFNLLNSSEPEPDSASGEWNKRVANLEELSYQDLAQVPVGYKYLVVSDSTQNGLWTIYTVTATKTFATLFLSRVQNYDTKDYWNYVTWYLPGYNSSNKIIAEVTNVAMLATLNLGVAPVGSSVKVIANSQGKFEIYLRSDTGWDRVGLQDGTIQFKEELWNYAVGRFGFDVEVFDAQHFDQEPVIETRKIIQAINEELLIEDLLIERNRALMLMFNFVLSEFEAPEWLTKTSLIDVEHKIRQLLPYQTYLRDNQDFVLNYIQEVKPYHVQIREFNLIYNGFDIYQGSMADFDLPAFYNTSQVPNQYMSPILTPYALSAAQGTGHPSTYSDVDPDSALWQTQPYSFWFDNYTLNIEDVVIADGGSGYTVAPQLTVTGDCVTQAQMIATVNSAGKINSVIITDPGSGYTTTATITVSGGNGVGGKIVAVMGNNLVRSINTTIKYDRYQYTTNVLTWEANVSYTAGTLVRYDNRVWSADSTVSGATTFDPDYWTLVPASGLSGVDRTMGFYTPGPDEPGLDLPLLIDGVDYPGVQVSAPTFSQNTGFDVGNFDINPFDNISYGPEGLPTYDPAILDAIYESPFTDPYLGTRATDINVDGGEFVGPYESHAPEELVPGSIFDTMDLRVYSRPITTYTGDGTTVGPYAAPTGSTQVQVAINNAVADPSTYTLSGSDVTFNTAPSNGAIIVILEVSPNAGIELRIFQDMRGVQATYRMTPATTTELTQTLYVDGDVVHVADASALAAPDLANNIWGIITINGERIMYREIDYVANTVSSLRRGTAGTAVDTHTVGSIVYNLNRDNLAPAEYQDHYVGSNTLANGTATTFTADVDLAYEDSTLDVIAVQVYVGGILQTSGYTLTYDNPVTVEFDTAPTAGYQVTIQIRQGLGWYGPGIYPTTGTPLQDATTLAAQFFRG